MQCSCRIHRIEFPSTLLTFNPEHYSFPPVLAQTAHLCLLSPRLRSFYSLCLFLQPWALFYLQDFEFSIDFKASAELLGSLVVDLVVADVQVNQHIIDFESFS